MARLRPRVISAGDAAQAKTRAAPTRDSADEDVAISKVIKYIPAEIIALHQALAGFAPTHERFVGWLIVALLMLTPFWFATATRSSGERIAWPQVILSTVAFGIWLLAVQSPALKLLPFVVIDAQASTILFVFFMGITPLLEKVVGALRG